MLGTVTVVSVDAPDRQSGRHLLSATARRDGQTLVFPWPRPPLVPLRPRPACTEHLCSRRCSWRASVLTTVAGGCGHFGGPQPIRRRESGSHRAHGEHRVGRRASPPSPRTPVLFSVSSVALCEHRRSPAPSRRPFPQPHWARRAGRGGAVGALTRGDWSGPDPLPALQLAAEAIVVAGALRCAERDGAQRAVPPVAIIV